MRARCLFPPQLDKHVVAHRWERRVCYDGTGSQIDRRAPVTYGALLGCARPANLLCRIIIHAPLLSDRPTEAVDATFVTDVFARVCLSDANGHERTTWMLDEQRRLVLRDDGRLPVQGQHDPPGDSPYAAFSDELNEVVAYIDACGDAREILRKHRQRGDGTWRLPCTYRDEDDDETESQDSVLSIDGRTYDLSGTAMARMGGALPRQWLIEGA